MSTRTIRRALLSVSDKTGLVDLAQLLASKGVTLISTGGTRRALTDAGLEVIDISEVTGFPEILEGRVKTLHPHVHAGILAKHEKAEHVETLKQHNIEAIDLIVCNLYPFEEKPGIENIDIGGPTLIRAAAKNYATVAVLTNPRQYGEAMSAIETENGFTLEAREKLAIAAFARIAQYDDAIQQWFAAKDNETFPENVALRYQKKSKLRYGENPHQKAAFYVESPTIPDSLAGAEILHGKELSFNNILDLDSALNLVREFDQPAVSVIKHNNPCGAAFGENLPDVFEAAYNGDPLSAFGGILAFNREVGIETANRIASPNRFLECIIAPSYSDDALKILRGWKKNLRLLSCGEIQKIDSGFDYRRVHGGMLIQERDVSNEHDVELEVVTDRSPTEEELANLRFAWIVCKHVKSNAIVFAKEGAVVGVGAGQMSRVDSVQIAARKSDARSEGAVLASDAFFPFRDNIDAAAKAGIKAVIQPGGSRNDQDAIDACNEHGLAMVFTGARHFRH